ncbi:MAG: hypothetical protein QCI00_09820 [Candidatus Thermoplasmatota archaeon]|nr:hypothetical protein [Candidatus Thermoplasmatota archaeon]
MKFATLAHLDNDDYFIKKIPEDWNKDKYIISPEFDCNGVKGHFLAIKHTAMEMMKLDKDIIRNQILEISLFAQDRLGVDLIQLGALTTSVTDGGVWLRNQQEYKGFVNHGDSYTAAVTIQAVEKALQLRNYDSNDLKLSIIGAYGIIGEAVSKSLVPRFNHTVLIGRRIEKFNSMIPLIKGEYDITTGLDTENADVIITATNHPTALLGSEHIKKEAIIVDVSQPPNVSMGLCVKRPDILRIDGGYVRFPFDFRIPTIPKGKLFSCIVEVIMQAMENNREHHVGSIDSNHLRKTEEWGNKYGFTLNELTNFGSKIKEEDYR